MPATVQAFRPASLNRRRRVRQKVHAPAYATFGSASNSGILNLFEVLDISEVGVAVQCATPIETNQQVELRLDLAEAQRTNFAQLQGQFGPTPPDGLALVLRLCRIPLSTACASGYFSMPWPGPPMLRLPPALPCQFPCPVPHFIPSSGPATVTCSLPRLRCRGKPSPWALTSRRFSPWLLPAPSLCFGLPERQLLLPEKTPEKMTGLALA